jgi:predicted lipoprotein with Yx(FWY)xxD motif
MKKVVYLFAASSLIVFSGCGGSSGTGTPSYGNTTAPVTSSTALGSSSGHLVDGNGRTLYQLEVPSACTGACVAAWPAFTASQSPSATDGLTGAIGLTSSDQVTYKGTALYYFVDDTAPGEATGNGVEGFYFVSP